MIWVNSENVRHLPTPFGGVKNSGIGRDGGDWSFDFYMETKNIAFATQPHAITEARAAERQTEIIDRRKARRGNRCPSRTHSPSALQHRAAEPRRARRDATSPKSRAFYVDTLGLQVTDETPDAIYLRAMEERGHHCIVLQKARRGRTPAISASRSLREEDLDKAAALLRGQGPAGRVGRAALSGPHLPHHATRTAFRSNSIADDGPPAADPSEIRALQRREAAAHRPLQLLLAERRRSRSPSTTRSASA